MLECPCSLDDIDRLSRNPAWRNFMRHQETRIEQIKEKLMYCKSDELHHLQGMAQTLYDSMTFVYDLRDQILEEEREMSDE